MTELPADAIRAMRVTMRGKRAYVHYLVKWTGESEKGNTWEKKSDIGKGLLKELNEAKGMFKWEYHDNNDGNWYPSCDNVSIETAYQSWLDGKGPSFIDVYSIKGSSKTYKFRVTFYDTYVEEESVTHPSAPKRLLRRVFA